MGKVKDLHGLIFQRLRVIEFVGLRATPSGRNLAYWRCECICGGEKIATGTNLLSGNTRSCGCLHKERASTANIVHSGAHTPEYHIYQEAKRRCISVNCKDYPYYGGRGIKFKFKSFEDFISHIGWRPKKKLSLDRINNNGHYEPGNVRWATKYQQTHNRRRQ